MQPTDDVHLVELLVSRREGVTLDDAFGDVDAHLDRPVAVGYGPGRCVLAQRCEHGGKMAWWSIDENAAFVESDFVALGIYEVRVFAEAGELRWLNDPARQGTGTAVLLSETVRPNGAWRPVELTEHGDGRLERCPNEYLLWGETLDDPGTPDSWQCLATGRVGRLYVPEPHHVPGTAGEGRLPRLVLKSWEYLGLEPGLAGGHGNVTVLAERLYGIGTLCTSNATGAHA